MKNEKLYKATTVLFRLAEIAHWIGAVGLVVGLVLTLIFGAKAVVVGTEDYGREISIYGLELVAVSADGTLNMTALRIYLVGGAVLMALMALVFRNVNRVMKAAENATPFQKDNVRRVREIGIFLLAMPLVSWLFSLFIQMSAGPELAESGAGMGSVVVGLVVLCLSQIFARGVALESDVDGLL